MTKLFQHNPTPTAAPLPCRRAAFAPGRLAVDSGVQAQLTGEAGKQQVPLRLMFYINFDN
jgi:hypothetical protein